MLLRSLLAGCLAMMSFSLGCGARDGRGGWVRRPLAVGALSGLRFVHVRTEIPSKTPHTRNPQRVSIAPDSQDPNRTFLDSIKVRETIHRNRSIIVRAETSKTVFDLFGNAGVSCIFFLEIGVEPKSNLNMEGLWAETLLLCKASPVHFLQLHP